MPRFREHNQRCLVLEVDDRGLIAVEADLSYPRPRITGWFEALWPTGIAWRRDPAAAGGWLRHQMDAAGITASITRVVLRRDQTIVRPLEIPRSDPGDTAGIVSCQAAVQLSVPVRDVVVDYIEQNDTSESPSKRVLLLAVPKSTIDSIGSLCEAAKLVAESIGLRAANVTSLTAAGQTESAVVIVVADDDSAEIAAMHGGRLVQAVSIPIDGGQDAADQVASGVARLRTSLQYSSVPDFSKLVVWGLPDHSRQLAKDLSRRFDGRTEIMDCEKLVGGLQLLTRRNPAGCVSALLAAAGGCTSSVSFLLQRKVRNTFLRRHAPLIAVLSVCVLICAWYSWKRVRDERLAAEIAQLGGEKRGLATRIESGRDAHEIAEWLRQWEQSRVDWVRELDGFAEQLPEAELLFFKGVHMESRPNGNSLRADGYARDRAAIMELNERLLARRDRYQLRPHGISPGRFSTEYPLRFEVEAGLNHPWSGDSAVGNGK